MRICTWKHGKDWVYSITYDEALADLSRFVIPAHQEFGIPGHVEVVAGQIGEIRRCGASSFNGMRHMDASELRALIGMGWGVGCHSWSHGTVMDDPDRELRQARETIEAAIGRPVTVYTSPGTNDNLTPDVQGWLREYGYLAGLSITDDINYPLESDSPLILNQVQDDNARLQDDGVCSHPELDSGSSNPLLWVNRIPIHERYWGVFDSAFDAHKRIRQAQDARGWIVDYCHCPLEQAVHGYKDCTAAHHRERLEAIVSEGGDRCWYANPDEVVDYRYMRRHARIESSGDGRFIVRLESLPKQVQCRELTFEVAGGRSFTMSVHDGMEIALPQRCE